ncbi:MAG: hypothetical protein ACXWKN_03535 [Phenylobacterium sp.]
MAPYELHFGWNGAPPPTASSTTLVAESRESAQLEAAIAFGNMDVLPGAFWITNAAGEVIHRWPA